MGLLLSACGGGGGGSTGSSGGSPPPPTQSFTVGGSITGLTGSGLVLQDNGGDSLAVAAGSKTFTFSTSVATGSKYAVTVLTAPTSPAQTCTVASGSGSVNGANLTSVAISCTNSTYTVGGTVTGLTGAGLVLQDNGGNSLTVPAPSGTASASFTFSTAVASGSAYAVTVSTQPTGPAQICSVTDGSGTLGASNVTTVQVNCANVGRFVFVANNSDGAQGDVAAFTITSSTGALTQVSGSPFLADQGPNGVVVDPTGQFVYVSNGATSDVSRLLLDATGALTLRGQFNTTSSVPESLAIAPSGAFLYTAGHGTSVTGTISGFTRDLVSGSLTGISTHPFELSHAQLGIAIDPTSHLIFSAGDPHFLAIDSIAADGTLTETPGSETATSEGLSGVAVWPKGGSTGYVYTTNNITGNVSAFSYDSSGNVTALAPGNAGHGTVGIAMDPAGKFLYVTNFDDGTLSGFSINAQTGALTSLGADVATGNLNGVANPGPIDAKIDPSSQFLYCVNKLDGSVSLFTISEQGALHRVATYLAGPDATGAGSAAIAVY
ncbi:MAG TPA: beta-propeller fold lactonase family protein [Steroidobacteraceae bacterium]